MALLFYLGKKWQKKETEKNKKRKRKKSQPNPIGPWPQLASPRPKPTWGLVVFPTRGKKLGGCHVAAVELPPPHLGLPCLFYVPRRHAAKPPSIPPTLDPSPFISGEIPQRPERE